MNPQSYAQFFKKFQPKYAYSCYAYKEKKAQTKTPEINGSNGEDKTKKVTNW